ncbi:MAG: hypothetical protein ACUVXA_02630 [Candidatus Jordarchaeum sp.]
MGLPVAASLPPKEGEDCFPGDHKTVPERYGGALREGGDRVCRG